MHLYILIYSNYRKTPNHKYWYSHPSPSLTPHHHLYTFVFPLLCSHHSSMAHEINHGGGGFLITAAPLTRSDGGIGGATPAPPFKAIYGFKGGPCRKPQFQAQGGGSTYYAQQGMTATYPHSKFTWQTVYITFTIRVILWDLPANPIEWPWWRTRFDTQKQKHHMFCSVWVASLVKPILG